MRQSVLEQDFSCVSEKLKFICEIILSKHGNPTTDAYDPILVGQAEHVLGVGEFDGQGFFDQFTRPKEAQ